MKPEDFAKLTPELLRLYQDGALQNATELCAEASLLLAHGHRARAYFLAVSTIEETGKALFIFDSQNRKLADPAVATRLKTNIENHSQKITYALALWAMSSSDQRKAILVAVDLISDLKRGREPSLYSDVGTGPDRILLPQDVVRETAARDSVRLATDCLTHARDHIKTKQPRPISRADDKLFTMKNSSVQKIFQTEDFWWYFLSRMEVGDRDTAQAVVHYDKNYLQKGMLFGKH
jgi:AbiV family abortive infection protein